MISSDRVEEITAALRDGTSVEDVAALFGIEAGTVRWYLKYALPCVTDFEARRKQHKQQCREHLQDLVREHRGMAVAVLEKAKNRPVAKNIAARSL